MAIDIRELFTPQLMAANWTEVASNYIEYIGPGLFPPRKKAGLDLSWLKGSKGLPVSLMPSAFDAKATFRDRIGVTKTETEMPFFREGFKIKEKDRQELLRVLDSNDPYALEVLERVFDDNAELIAGAHVVAERMRMQLLFPVNGNVGITIKANGVDYTYNYDQNGDWKTDNYIALTGSDLWSAPATADPFAAFDTAKDAVSEKTGTELRTAIMNKYTFNLLRKVDAVKNRWLSVNGKTLSYLTDNEIKEAIAGATGINILVWDKAFKDESKATQKFVPNGYVAMIPDGALGSTWYGTTPEEADLAGSGQADVAIVDTGIAITREVQAHPVNVNIYASEIVLPSYERMDEVAVLKVIS